MPVISSNALGLLGDYGSGDTSSEDESQKHLVPQKLISNEAAKNNKLSKKK